MIQKYSRDNIISVFRIHLSHLWLVTTALLVGMLLFSCEDPDSLTPPSGIEGKITYTGTWPDSIKAAALIVLTGLDETRLADYLVTFTTPDLPPTENSEYFFQLEPGFYFIAGVGLTIDPVLFFSNYDSILISGNLPIVLLNKEPSVQIVTNVNDGEVQIRDQKIIF